MEVPRYAGVPPGEVVVTVVTLSTLQARLAAWAPFSESGVTWSSARSF